MTDIQHSKKMTYEYTATTSGIQSTENGVYQIDFYDGGGAGAVSIDLWVPQDAAYRTSTVAPLIGSVEYHAVIRVPPEALFRITMSGTDPVVLLTPVKANHI